MPNKIPFNRPSLFDGREITDFVMVTYEVNNGLLSVFIEPSDALRKFYKIKNEEENPDPKPKPKPKPTPEDDDD